MPYMKIGSQFLYDNASGDIVGVKDPDGSELYFARVPSVGSFYDVSDQSASANTATPMECDTTDISSGVTMVSNSRITFSHAGIYNIQFSAQFKNVSNTSEYNVSIWFAKNTVNLDNSTTAVTVPKSHGGGDGLLVTAWNYFVEVAAGDFVQILWSTPSSDVSLEYAGPATTPTRPAIPSVIITVNGVSGL
jgi:hypothetical protein